MGGHGFAFKAEYQPGSLKNRLDHADCANHIVPVQINVSLGGDVQSLALSRTCTIIQCVGDV